MIASAKKCALTKEPDRQNAFSSATAALHLGRPPEPVDRLDPGMRGMFGPDSYPPYTQRPDARNRTVLLLVFLLFFSSFAYGQNADPTPLYMWHISRGDVRMFLLGSIHVLTSDFYPLPPAVEEARQLSDILVLEAVPNPGPKETAEISRLTSELGFYRDGTTLKTHVPGTVFETILHRAERYGLLPEQLELMKPWLLTLTLQVLELRLSGYLPEYGMEAVIASTFNGPVLELEGAESQIRLMAGLTDPDQLRLLEVTIEDLDGMSGEVDRYLQAWKAGNTDLLEGLLGSEGSDGNIEELLIHRRNIAMTEKIESLLNDNTGTMLLLAGALHFVGETGIPELLSDRGFLVHQVMSDGSLRISGD